MGRASLAQFFSTARIARPVTICALVAIAFATESCTQKSDDASSTTAVHTIAGPWSSPLGIYPKSAPQRTNPPPSPPPTPVGFPVRIARGDQVDHTRSVGYTVTQVNPSPGYGIPLSVVCDKFPKLQFESPTGKSYALPPPAISLIDMNEHGDVGFVERLLKSPCASDLITVIHESGRRATIAAPHAQMTSLPDGQFVADLRLASDGTPFVTMGAQFSGAYSGVSERVLSWNGKSWISRDVDLPVRYSDADNRSIGAVETPSRFGVTGDSGDATGFDYYAHERDSTYDMPEAGISDGDVATSLGVGTITSMRGHLTSGYLQPYGWCWQGGTPIAVRWLGAKKRLLGPGIAYGVDVNGDVVGSGRPLISPTRTNNGVTEYSDCKDEGHPMLWRENAAVQLSSLAGSALAIRDGTIVGTIGGRAFLSHADELGRKLHYLDDVVSGHWKFTKAIAIDGNGRILAIGRDDHSLRLRILILEPIRSRP